MGGAPHMPVFSMYWRRTLRRPGTLYLWLALPFVFMAIYEMAFGGNGPAIKTGLALVDRDSTTVSRFVQSAFGQGPIADLITTYPAADMDEVERMFADQKASAALVIPDSFSTHLLRDEPAPLVLYTNPRHTIGPQICDAVVGTLAEMGNGLVGTFAAPLRRMRSFYDSDSTVTADDVAQVARMFFEIGDNAPNLAAVTRVDVSVVDEEAGEKKEENPFNLAALFFPGLIVFGLLSTSLGLEARLLNDRVAGVTRRFITAPVHPMGILWQQRIFEATFLFVVAVVSAVLGGAIWRIAPVGLAKVGVIAVALVLFIVGINGIIFSLSNSRKATAAVSSFVMIFLMSLGGGFFPSELIPSSFQTFSRWMPTGMANLGLTHALTGRPMEINLAVLFVYCAAFFVASIALGRRAILGR